MRSEFFQYVVLGIFGLLGVVGLIFFATNDPDKEALLLTPLTIWGPYDTNAFEAVLKVAGSDVGGLTKVSYKEKSRAVLYSELIEQLASGGGPDVVIMDDDRLISFINKIYPLSAESYPPKLFREQFVQGSEAFMFDGRTFAVPYAIDPIVMYYNRDIFNTAGITVIPKFWDEFKQIVPRLTIIRDGSTILQSSVAFGEYDNVLHAKDILSMLMFQAGNPIVTWDQSGYRPTLAGGDAVNTGVAALSFYTEFSNPTKKVYSWNRSFERSREAFVAGRVATYFGYASERELLRNTNPNLNFDVAVVPQARTGTRTTYGTFSGLAIMRSSSDPARALSVIQALTSAPAIAALVEQTGLPPIRNDLLFRPPVDTYGSVAYDSAIIARTWLEPSGADGEKIFGKMINDVLAGKVGISEALSNASNELQAQAPSVNERLRQ